MPGGLNVDFMTHAMYRMANKDPKALLNVSTLQRLAETTFSTFFQHYVSSNVSMEKGSWAYQRTNAGLSPDFGLAMNTTTGNASAEQEVWHPISHANRTVVAQVITPIELLRVDLTAVWHSSGILVWLLVSAVIVAGMQRRYFKGMVRNVECMADVLVLVAGLERLLRVLREKGVDELKRGDEKYSARLGWFIDSNGRMRWGVEIAEPNGESTSGNVEEVTWVSDPRRKKRKVEDLEATMRSEEELPSLDN